MFFYWFCYILFYIPLKLFFPTKVIGKENLPKRKKAILSCNHRSNMDVFIVNHSLPCRTYTPAKTSLFKNKLKGAILKSWGAIPVERGAVGVSTIRTILGFLKKEQWLLIFPEGTRKDISNDEQMSLKNGTALFALKSGAPIIPMWLMKRPRIFCRNILLIGKPFYLEQMEGQKLTNEVLTAESKKISQEMQKLRDGYIKEQKEKQLAKLNKKKHIKK